MFCCCCCCFYYLWPWCHIQRKKDGENKNQVYSIKIQEQSHTDLFSLSAGVMHLFFPPHAHSVGDGFFWERYKRWPILAGVCLHGRWPSVQAFCHYHSTPPLPGHTHKYLFFPPTASAGRAYFLPISACCWIQERECVSLYFMCVFVCELFSVPGKYSNTDLFSQETESRLDPTNNYARCFFIYLFSPPSSTVFLSITLHTSVF